MAAQSATDVCNLALAHLGGAPPFLTDITTDTTKAGKLLRQVLDNSRKATLRAAYWNFAIERVLLELDAITAIADNGAGLIRVTIASHPFITGDRVSIVSVLGTTEANGTWVITKIDANSFDLQESEFTSTYISGGVAGFAPPMDYTFKHSVPTDFVRLVKVGADGDQIDYRFEKGYIVTDESEIYLKYVADVTDYTLMDPQYYSCLALHLAWAVCYALTQSNKLKEEIMKAYSVAIRFAKNSDSTEDPLKTLEANTFVEARTSFNGGFVRNPGTR